VPRLANVAALKDFSTAIISTTAEITRQIGRMDLIYQALHEVYQPDDCIGFKYLIDDVLEDVALQQGEQLLQDMAIIYYLQNMEAWKWHLSRYCDWQLLNLNATR
jgi:hypothetical protein